jgi:hypothetical protein
LVHRSDEGGNSGVLDVGPDGVHGAFLGTPALVLGMAGVPLCFDNPEAFNGLMTNGDGLPSFNATPTSGSTAYRRGPRWTTPT